MFYLDNITIWYNFPSFYFKNNMDSELTEQIGYDSLGQISPNPRTRFLLALAENPVLSLGLAGKSERLTLLRGLSEAIGHDQIAGLFAYSNYFGQSVEGVTFRKPGLENTLFPLFIYRKSMVGIEDDTERKDSIVQALSDITIAILLLDETAESIIQSDPELSSMAVQFAISESPIPDTHPLVAPGTGQEAGVVRKNLLQIANSMVEENILVKKLQRQPHLIGIEEYESYVEIKTRSSSFQAILNTFSELIGEAPLDEEIILRLCRIFMHTSNLISVGRDLANRSLDNVVLIRALMEKNSQPGEIKQEPLFLEDISIAQEQIQSEICTQMNSLSNDLSNGDEGVLPKDILCLTVPDRARWQAGGRLASGRKTLQFGYRILRMALEAALDDEGRTYLPEYDKPEDGTEKFLRLAGNYVQKQRYPVDENVIKFFHGQN